MTKPIFYISINENVLHELTHLNESNYELSKDPFDMTVEFTDSPCWAVLRSLKTRVTMTLYNRMEFLHSAEEDKQIRVGKLTVCHNGKQEVEGPEDACFLELLYSCCLLICDMVRKDFPEILTNAEKDADRKMNLNSQGRFEGNYTGYLIGNREGKWEITTVRGKDRPDLLVPALLGGLFFSRPYLEDVLEREQEEREDNDPETDEASPEDIETARVVAAKLFSGRNSRALKELLLAPADDSFEELCEKEIVNIDPDSIYSDRNDVCLFVDSKDASILSNEKVRRLNFDIACKRELYDLEGYRTRPLEIASLIIDTLDRKELEGYGKIRFVSCEFYPVSDQLMSTQLMFLAGEDQDIRRNMGKTCLKDYDADFKALIGTLLKEPGMKEAMGIENLTDEEAYSKGYVRLSNIIGDDVINSQVCRILITRTFGFNADISIFLSGRDEERNASVNRKVKDALSGFSLASGKKIRYSEETSMVNILEHKGCHVDLLNYTY